MKTEKLILLKILVLNFLNKIIFSFLVKKKFDYFSGLKLFKRSLYDKLNYRGLVRFLIFYCIEKDINVEELSINHSYRLYGHSKYTFFNKFYLFMLDLLTIVTFIKITPPILVKFKKKFFDKIFLFLSLICIVNFSNLNPVFFISFFSGDYLYYCCICNLQVYRT